MTLVIGIGHWFETFIKRLQGAGLLSAFAIAELGCTGWSVGSPFPTGISTGVEVAEYGRVYLV